MYKVTCGETVFFDVDDTLVMFCPPDEIVKELDLKANTFHCRGKVSKFYINEHNIKLLKDLSVRGHAIVVWSTAGSDWCEAVVKNLELEEYVEVVMGKPAWYIDDKEDPRKWMGTHEYIDLYGKPTVFHPQQARSMSSKETSSDH